MTETTRIRWADGQWGNLVGYVGTLEPWAFQIWHIIDAGHWTLVTSFPEHQTPISTSADPEKLKGRAEEWLTGFVASLGAVFPEPASFTATRDRLATALTRLDVRVLASGPCAGMVDAWSMADAVIEALRETETTALVAAEE